jgi:hypothetical protein
MRSLHGRILQLVADQSERVLGNGSEAASAVTIAPSNWNARWLGQKPLAASSRPSRSTMRTSPRVVKAGYQPSDGFLSCC